MKTSIRLVLTALAISAATFAAAGAPLPANADSHAPQPAASLAEATP